MSHLSENCLNCNQTYYQQSLIQLEYVDFSFGGHQISLIGCFVEASETPSASANGPKVCLTCLEVLRSSHVASKRKVIDTVNVHKSTHICTTCFQLTPANNTLNMRLTVVNANGRQVNLEDCIKACRREDQRTGENSKICLACVSVIVEDYTKLPEFWDFGQAEIKTEPMCTLETFETDPHLNCKPEPAETFDLLDVIEDDEGNNDKDEPNAMKCSECPVKFETSEQIVHHERDVHQTDQKKRKRVKKNFTGSFRERVLQSRQAMAAALEQKHQPLEEFKCDWVDCNRVFKSDTKLEHHQKKHEEHGTECRLCDKTIFGSEAFKEHLTVHMTIAGGRLRCDQCDRVFANYNNARKHVHTERNRLTPYRCHHCKYTSEFLPNLRRHLWIFHFRTAFECRLCNHVSESNKAYRQHLNTHKAGQFKCAICQRKFLTEKTYEYHKSRWTSVFPCPKCETRVHTLAMLERHMEEEHNEMYPCHICNQPFRNTYSLGTHLRRLHGVLAKSICRKCGRDFDSPAELKAHTENEHQKIGKMNYVCEQCGHSFNASGELGKHIKKHATARDYPCRQCDRVYKTARALNNHVETIHLKTKNRRSTNMIYTCPKCPQWKFARHQALEGHMIVHNTENRPYFQCNQCGIAYTRRQKFDVHVKNCAKN